MTLIPIMIPLQTGQIVQPPDPGAGRLPTLFFDAKKGRFSLRAGLSIGRRITSEASSHAILRRHGLGEARLYSGLKKQETHRTSGGISLGHGQSRTVAQSYLAVRKQTRTRASAETSLSQHAHRKIKGQAAISKTQTSKNESRIGVSRKEKKRTDARSLLRKRRKNRTEAHAEQDDDSELLVAASE